MGEATVPTPAPWRDVTSARAARLLCDPQARRVLAAFLPGRTVTQAARALGLGVDDVRYRVKRGVDAGLLHVTGSVPRRGPPQTVYTLPATPWFTPGDLLPGGPDTLLHHDEDAFTRRLRDSRARLLRGGGWGLLVQPGGEGLTAEITRPRVDRPILHALAAQDAPAIVDLSVTLALTHGDAKALQAELLAVYARYADRAQDDGSVLLRVSLYPA